MTRCRPNLERRLVAVREENRALARKAIKRLLGRRDFRVLVEDKDRRKWKHVATYPSREEAEKFARWLKRRYWLVEEIVE